MRILGVYRYPVKYCVMGPEPGGLGCGIGHCADYEFYNVAAVEAVNVFFLEIPPNSSATLHHLNLLARLD